MPASLRQYAPLFAALDDKEELDDDFDEQILAMTIGDSDDLKVKARTVSITERLSPLLKAAAVVAVVLTLSNAINQSFKSDSTWVSPDDYAAVEQPNTDEPAMAYDQAADSLLTVTDSLRLSTSSGIME